MNIKAYLDTNLIIEHCWWKFFGNEKDKMTKEVELIEEGFQGKFDIYISYITIMELSNHLTDWFLLEKVIKSGFGFPHFKREKMKYVLTVEQKALINKITQEYQNSPYVFYIEIDGISNEFFKQAKLLVDNYMEFEDALHFLFAQASNTDYFVTKDGELRLRLHNIISTNIMDLQKSPSLIEPSKFLKLIK